MSKIPGYNDIDLMAKQSAMQTLVLVAIAKKVITGEDHAISAWVTAGENDARSTLERLEQQAKERLKRQSAPLRADT